MPNPPKLTEVQRRRLATLEPALRASVRRGDYTSAKRQAGDIQTLLRPTGHETRLMQAKNWLFEAAMEAGNLQIAIAGFEGIRKKVNSKTRIYLEATALLAICHIRQRNLGLAEPLMAEVLRNDKAITSERRRRQFRARIVQRFQQEGVLAALQGEGNDQLDPDEIEAEAARDVQGKTEDEMFADLGRTLPESTVAFLLKIDQFARRQLPVKEIKYLQPPVNLLKNSDLGRAAAASIGRVLWRSLCDPESDIYKAWYTGGLSMVLSKRYLSACIIGTLSGFGIALKGLCVSLVALIIKFGIEIYCDMTKPRGVMIGIGER